MTTLRLPHAPFGLVAYMYINIYIYIHTHTHIYIYIRPGDGPRNDDVAVAARAVQEQLRQPHQLRQVLGDGLRYNRFTGCVHTYTRYLQAVCTYIRVQDGARARHGGRCRRGPRPRGGHRGIYTIVYHIYVCTKYQTYVYTELGLMDTIAVYLYTIQERGTGTPWRVLPPWPAPARRQSRYIYDL